ncbi:hypothetical protein OKW11_005152 [Pseudomonas baetica]|nr:hypothetical protein [Pseudomonas baetica]
MIQTPAVTNREELYDRYQLQVAQLPLCFTWVVVES